MKRFLKWIIYEGIPYVNLLWKYSLNRSSWTLSWGGGDNFQGGSPKTKKNVKIMKSLCFVANICKSYVFQLLKPNAKVPDATFALRFKSKKHNVYIYLQRNTTTSWFWLLFLGDPPWKLSSPPSPQWQRPGGWI